MYSRIHESDKIINADRKFGPDPCYYPAILMLPSGAEELLLLTNEQVNTARQRASFNPEDSATIVEAAASAENRVGVILVAAAFGAALLGAVIVAVWP